MEIHNLKEILFKNYLHLLKNYCNAYITSITIKQYFIGL